VFNATRALAGIEHTPFEANVGLSNVDLHDLHFSMRPSLPGSQDAYERLRLLHDVHAQMRSALHLHKDDMQARS
jgi:hypothetical protein